MTLAVHRTALLGAAVLTVFGLSLAAAPAADAAVSNVTFSAPSVAAAPDFATNTYGDPWDYGNPDDFDNVLQSWMVGASNVGLANGMLSLDMTSMGQLPLVRGFGAIDIPWGRDGSAHPIDASVYTHLAFRMNAGINSPQAGQIVWMNCGTFVASCEGAQQITVKPGWNTYDITLQNGYVDQPAAWAGAIHSLVLVPVGPGVSSAHVDLDWVRLYQPTAPVTVTFTDSNPGGSVGASWAASATASDFTAPANQSGRFATIGSSASTNNASFNAAAFPPGTYRFFATDTDSSTSPPSPPFTILASPAVSQLAPEPVQGADYASLVRGDPWDFSQATDVSAPDNAALSYDGQLVHGQNAGPHPNDPSITLAVPAPIDGDRFHRFSMRIHFDGAFSLSSNPGGGMNARLYWKVAGSDVAQASQDILVYPGWQTITLDLASPNILDEGQPAGSRFGWAGHQITSFRIDPNEDPGPRTWAIDWARLGSDSPFGSFDGVSRVPGGLGVGGWVIDPDTSAPAQVHVYVDSAGYSLGNAAGERPDVAAVYPGFGTAHGFGGVVPAGPGPHNVCAYGINQGPGANSSLGCKHVVVEASPFGSLDVVRRAPGGVSVFGWAIDPDMAAPAQVHVYVDSAGYSLGNAAGDRPDVGAVFPAYGAAHGYNSVVPAGPGQHTVCAYGINQGPGANSSFGCRSVVVDASPFGSLDVAQRTSGGYLVGGWAIDPDTAGPIQVHVYVDSAGYSLGNASGDRGDVAGVYPAYGAAHGYTAIVPAGAGVHTVCAYGINQGLGANSSLGCRTLG